MTCRVLVPGDEPSLEAFLADHADSSMILRSNLRAAGIVDHGQPLEATYAAAFAGDRIVAVAAHCWNGMVVLQAPERLDEVVATATTARAVTGLIGPLAQCRTAQRLLGDRPVRLESPEDLYALDLAALRIPDALAAGRVICRRPERTELDVLAGWRHDYHVEVLGGAAGPALREAARGEIDQLAARGHLWVLEDAGCLSAMTAFNAALPEMVQVGGVYTPPDLRGRGLARAVVAGSLCDARDTGARRAILFTENPAAASAYLALGFAVVGDHGIILFGE